MKIHYVSLGLCIIASRALITVLDVPKYQQVNIFQKVHFVYTSIKEFEQTNQHDSTVKKNPSNFPIKFGEKKMTF